MKTSPFAVRILVPALAAWLIAAPLRATPEFPTLTWTGATSSNAGDDTNWDASLGANQNVVFGTVASGRYTVFIPAIVEGAATFNHISFVGESRPAYTFAGAPSNLAITGDFSVETSGNITFGNSISVELSNGYHSITVTPAETLLRFDGVVSGDGETYLAQYGDGMLALGGQNTFDGLSVYGGTVLAGASSIAPEGISSGPLGRGWVKLYDGSTLGHTSSLTTLHNFLDLDCGSETQVTFDSGGGVLEIHGQVTGSAQIRKTGSGTLVLANATSDNTGGIDVTAGTLQVAANSDLEMQTGPAGWGGTIVLRDGTTLQKQEEAGDVTLFNDLHLASGSATIDPGQMSNFALLGRISGSGALVKVDTGYLTLGQRDGGGFAELSESDFSGGVTVQAGTLIIGSSSYYGDGYLFGPVGSGVLRLKDGSALRVAANSYDITLHNEVELDTTANTSVTVGTEYDSLELYGNISGAAKLVKEGGQSLRLSGANTFTGGVTVNEGTLEIDSATATGSGLLQLSGSNPVTVDINAGAATVGGINGGTTGTVIGLRGEVGTDLTIDQATNGTYEGAFDGGDEDSIKKTGSATLTLTGNSPTYGGRWDIDAGTLAVSSDTQLGEAPESATPGLIKLDGGTLRTTASFTLDAHRGIVLGGNGGTLSPDASTTLAYGGVIADPEVEGFASGSPGTLTKAGAGTLSLTGTNTYAGPTKIVGGTLTIDTVANGGAASAIGAAGSDYENLWISDGTLRYQGGLASTDRLFSIGANATLDASGSGPVNFSNTGALGLLAGGSRTFTLRGSNTGSNVFAPVLADKDGSNPTSLAKADGGTWVIVSAQTYTGATLVNGGTLRLGVDHALAASTAVTVGSGATLDLSARNLAIASLAGLGTVSMSAPGEGNSFLEIGGTNASSAFNGVLSGSANNGLVKSGTGRLTLTGTNTYGGGTGVNAGTLRITNGGALGSGAVIVASDATLDLHHNLVVSSTQPLTVSGAGVGGAGAFVSSEGHGLWMGSVSLGGGNANLGGAGTLEIDGVVSGSASLTKVGSGDLILNATNTYSGGTVIKQGTIHANAASSLGSGGITFEGGALNVASGITLANSLTFSSGTTVLAGNGTFANHLTANEHVVLAPGNSPGTLTFSGGLTLASGSAISFQVQNVGTTAGAGWDLLSVSNGLVITAAAETITFNITFLDSSGNAGLPTGFNASNDYSWTFATSTTPITGFNANQFHLVTEGPSAPYGFTVSQSNDGLSLLVNYSPNFAPVPEPSTYALLALGLGFVGLTLWRRRRA